jgi:hypothetical protein
MGATLTFAVATAVALVALAIGWQWVGRAAA